MDAALHLQLRSDMQGGAALRKEETTAPTSCKRKAAVRLGKKCSR